MGNPPEFFGPIPPFNNPAIMPQYFQPSQFFISAIAQGVLTTVTTTVNHNFVVGQQCRLLIPQFNGIRTLNEVSGYVKSIPNPNQVVLNINSFGMTSFKTSTYPTQPQIIAIGDINMGLISSTGSTLPTTAIPGSFQNISPL